MPRSARIIVVGMPHHVTQRGNYRQKVFASPQDYRKYCYLAAEHAQKCKVDILAYCLMPNHIHFVVVPQTLESLAKFFSLIHMLYSQHKNKQDGKTGHLWQGRFYSCVLDEAHLLHTVRYVERNPLRAKLAYQPEQYIWSSAAQHLGIECNPLLKTTNQQRILELLQKGQDWKGYLSQEDEVMEEKIRKQTKKMAILGSAEFIKQVKQEKGLD